MKLITLLSFVYLACLTSACGQSYQYEEEPYNQQYTEASAQQYDTNNNEENSFTSNQPNRSVMGNNEIIMHSIKDNKTGMIVGQMPLPSDWKIENSIIKGPNGIQAGDLQGGSFMEQQRSVTSVDQIVREDVIPRIKQLGGAITNTFRIPEIAQNDQRTYAQYWKVAPTQDSHDAMGIEFNNPDGQKLLVIVHFTYSRMQYGNMSFYYMNQFMSNADAYEEAKRAYLYGLINFKMNPQHIAAHNQREQQKSQVSWNNHNQKMRNNQANFDARQKIHVDTYNSINQMSMDTYRNNSNASDRMQEQSVNGIWEQQNMVDPYTGENVKVDGYNNQYYMNNNNEYIGTDDYNYNPNTDPNLNNTEWRQIQPQQQQNNNNY
jgi:hypothetical protein